MGSSFLSSIPKRLVDIILGEITQTHGQRALDPLTEESAAVVVDVRYLAAAVIGVGRAATGTVELGPAILASGAGIGVDLSELVAEFLAFGADAVPDIAQLALLVAYELVAGEKIAPGSNGHIFRSCATARDPLIDTGPACKIQHIVVEGKAVALFIALYHLTGESLILLTENGEVLFCQGGRRVGRCDYRFHRKLLEAQIRHMQDVIYKVRIEMSESAAHIIALVAARFHKLFELGDDAIVGAVALYINSESVVDFFTAVKTQDHIVHLLVTEVDDVLIDVDAVGGQSESDILIVDLLLLASVNDQLLADFPVHQRLSAEEVDIKILMITGILDQEIDSALAGLVAHKTSLAMEVALTGEAVGAIEIAGVGYMQAEGLQCVASFLKINSDLLIFIGSKELTLFLK